ncbi:MAG: protein translocase subunit SecD [Proteobacteria bacterium]|jgi:preprotein translocase subunit SecD|nr:protein translocase subunit SecD [Pseudomonadota bacterium]
MMNRYPIWGYLALTAVILIGALYAIPNLYPEDPSVQISHDSGSLPADLKQRVESILSLNEMEAKQIEVNQQQQLLLRFDNTELQLQAADELKSGLNSEHIVALNLAPAVPAWLRAVNASPMSLGLDLRGGVHFLLQVDMTAAVSKALDRYEADFRSVLRENKVRYISVKHNGDVLNATFKDEESYQQGLDALKENFRLDLDFTKIKAERGITLVAAFKLAAQQELQNFALQQNITTLRKRVNELGVAEPVIQRQGTDRIVVQLPGVQDTARAKELLGATATLEFRLVDEQGDAFAAESSGNTPIGDKLYYERNGTPVLLKSRVMLSGEYITDAASGIDQDTATPAVFITLDGKGSRLFSKVTGDNIKRLMAVVFIESKTEYFKDEQGQLQSRSRKVEEVINIARIQDQLSKRFQITGLDTSREARKLALLLRAGALAAPMNIIEERTVGPSLGQQNIDQGKNSVVLGMLLVMIFMVLYYRVFGLVANVALITNLVLIIAILSMIPGATLTLPGIAGIVLTVGMAVDANVLIFERIREELSNGNSPQASIHAGYAKALSTIADANVTTLLAAIVLFTFGTGPIKGFAVTLSIGILCSMFTAILVTRALINLYYGRKQAPSLAI